MSNVLKNITKQRVYVGNPCRNINKIMWFYDITSKIIKKNKLKDMTRACHNY